MSDWKIKIKKSAKSDLKKVLKSPFRSSFEEIVTVLQTNPYLAIQSFEKLTPPTAGYYSRRINGQHQMVYKIDNDQRIVEIYSYWAHYKSGALAMKGKSSARQN